MKRTCILFLTYLVFVTTALQSRGSPGDSCSTSDDCGSVNQFLECFGVECRCIGNDEAVFIPSTQTCFLLADVSCETTSGLVQKCIPNSKCLKVQTQTRCVCNPGLDINADRMCFLSHSKVCNPDIDLCDPKGYLSCGLQKKCECLNQRDALYDDVSKTCKLLTEAFCTESDSSQKCVDNASCKDDKCQCDSTFEPTMDRQCRKESGNIGESCTVNPEDTCNQDKFLECGPQLTCTCKNPEDSWYDSNTDTCFILAETTCSQGIGEQKCIPNSECSLQEGIPKCRCNYNLEENSVGLCFLLHNKPCDSKSRTDICDPYGFLSCSLEEKCECQNPESSVYEERKRSCSLFVNEDCSTDDGSQSCAENSECKDAKCECDEGYGNINGLCVSNSLSFGEDCNADDDRCDDRKHLICSTFNGTCECRGGNDGWYNLNTDSCYLLPNSECSTLGQQCSPDSHCVPYEGLHICKCKNNLEPTDRQCLLPYDFPCQRGLEFDSCDHNEFMECGLESRCSCQNPEISYFDFLKETCVLFAEASCSLEAGAQTCTQDAVCSITSQQCICEDNFESTISRVCRSKTLEHGVDCEIGIEDRCDDQKFLICGESKQCVCQDETDSIYDPATKSCFVQSGKACVADNELHPKCLPGSQCIPSDGSMKCICDVGLIPNADGRCILTYNSKCHRGSKFDFCNPLEFLECGHENRCICKNLGSTSYYDSSSKSCRLLADAYCGDDPSDQECGKDSKCLAGKCNCNPGFEINSDRMCSSTFLQHGHRCKPGEDDHCDDSKFIECGREPNEFEFTCICKEKENTWFDPNSRMCYVKANSDCGITEQKCTPNSECILSNNEHKCVCNGELKPNIDHQCFLPYNSTCRTGSSELCDPSGYLECNLQGVCGCQNPMHSFYNAASKSCELLISAECSTAYGAQSCVEYATCERKICMCKNGLGISGERFCYLPHGAQCDATSFMQDRCDKEKRLECGSNGKCACSNSENTFYDTTTESCMLLEGAICSSNKNSNKCAPKSQCLSVDGYQKCVCNDNLQPNRDRLCYQMYNDTCSRNQDHCDPSGFLHCGLNSKCICENSVDSWYDPMSKKCQLLVNAKCDIKENSPGCVDNANCDGIFDQGICTCENFLQTSDSRHCALTHGMYCFGSNDICDRNKGLECHVNSFCVCQRENETWYDRNTQTCHLLEGTTCDPFSDHSFSCIPNSHCDLITKRCECSGSFEANKKGHCFLSFGKNCSRENDLCDKNAFLECEQNSICACQSQPLTWYDKETQSCHLRANTPCSNEELEDIQQCVENSICEQTSGGDPNRCTCVGNLKPNNNKLCFLEYNQSCSVVDNLCDPDGFLLCNDAENNRCTCADQSLIYNVESRSCDRIPEFPCLVSTKEPKCVMNSECDITSRTCKCVEGYENSGIGSCLRSYGSNCSNAFDDCNQFNQLHCINGHCICKPGLLESETDDGVKCLAGYKQKCSPQSLCSVQANLVCVAGLCECELPNEQIFDTIKQKCTSLPGSRCTISSNNTGQNDVSLPCIENAECIEQSGEAFVQMYANNGICICKAGYQVDIIGQCSSATFAKTFFGTVFVSLLLIFLNR